MPSVRSTIFAEMQDTIGALTTVGGYNFNWRNAYTRARAAENFKAFPSCNLLDGGQTYDDTVAGMITRRWVVQIEAVHKVVSTDDDDAQTVIDKMLEDLETGLLVDITRGGKAQDTTILRAAPSVNFEGHDYVVAHLDVEIHYRAAYANPATVR